MRRIIIISLITISTLGVFLFGSGVKNASALYCVGVLKCHYEEEGHCYTDNMYYTTGDCGFEGNVCDIKVNNCYPTQCLISDTCHTSETQPYEPPPGQTPPPGYGYSCTEHGGTCVSSSQDCPEGLHEEPAWSCPAGKKCCMGLSCTESDSVTVQETCNAQGFLGVTTATLNNRTIGYGYTCNASESVLGGTACGWWDNRFTGYLNIPESGSYEFWVTYNPKLTFKIDVNGDDAFGACANTVNHTPGRVGDNFLFIARKCSDAYRYLYLPSWGVVPSAEQQDCWKDFPNRIFCDSGRHCEDWDFRTQEVTTYPNIITPMEENYQGTEECPISITSTNENFTQQNYGWGNAFFTRTFTSSDSYKLDLNFTANVGPSDGYNNAYLKIRYRKVGSPTWIDLSNSATYPGGTCPVTPCPACTLAGSSSYATGLNLSNITSTSATLNWTPAVNPGTKQIVEVRDVSGSVIKRYDNLGVNVNSQNIDGLTANTYYEFYVINWKASDCYSEAGLAETLGFADAWWQVKDADVMGGIVNSTVPSTPGIYFDSDGVGGFPGIVIYRDSTNLTNITPNNVSAIGWLAGPMPLTFGTGYNASYFLNNIPSSTPINEVLVGTQFNSAYIAGKQADDKGYIWFRYNSGSEGVPLDIGSLDVGNNKVILLVDGANVNIGANINRTLGRGFFMLVTSGKIIVNPTVGGGVNPNLEGIFVADDNFEVPAKPTPPDIKLWVKGTVVTYGNALLQRTLEGGNSDTSAHFFEYAPDLEFLFPTDLSERSSVWREVAP